MTALEILRRLESLGNPEAAAFAARYFKTGPGGYGAGDVFLGLRVPKVRELAKEYAATPEDHVLHLLRSEVHEARLLALLILVSRALKGGEATRRRIYDLYLTNTAYVNNWDLVDTSARDIVGVYLVDRSRRPLDRLAASRDLWERRISIIATHAFIRRGEVADTFRIAEQLMTDREDLIHKAVGWMLREAGKSGSLALEAFLLRHRAKMPRTMLRYAIERFPEDRRRAFLKGEPAKRTR